MKKKIMKSIVLSWALLLVVTISMTVPQIVNANPIGTSSYNDGIWVNVTKEVYPTQIHPCEPVTISINVTAEGEPQAQTH